MPALLLGMLALALPVGATAAEVGTGTISGTVTEELGGPMAEVDVCAETVEETWFKCDTTRLDGTYQLTGLPAGRYKVGFWAKGNFITQFWEKEPTWSTATPIEVGAGIAITAINATIERGATISGLVTARATGAPVPGVVVCASAGELERCAKTSALGLYTVVGLAEGTWTIDFYPEKTEAGLLSQPYSGGAVAVGAQEAKPGVNAELVAGGQIAGTVRAAGTGAPLGGVLVCATTAASPQPLTCLHTPATGAYRFTGVWEGSFKIVFSPEPGSLPTQWWSGSSTFEAATPITIVPPSIVDNVDASLVVPVAAAAPPPPPPAPPVAKKKPVRKCRRGFVKRKVHGKRRCVRRRHAKPRHRRPSHRQEPKRRATAIRG